MEKRASRLGPIGVLFGALSTIAFSYPYSGGSGTGADPYRVANKTDLLALASSTDDYGKRFVLTADVDLGGETFPTAVIAPDMDTSTAGFQGSYFTGVLDGSGHQISNFSIVGDNNDYIGLFGFIDSGGTVKNLGLANFAVSGRSYVGGVAGHSTGSLTSCNASGSITGYDSVGGLVGDAGGTISSSHARGNVTGGSHVGGLAGLTNALGKIRYCSSTGSVSGTGGYVGGLIGESMQGEIRSCYATGAVNGDYYVGGLIGWNYQCRVIHCYSIGKAIGSSRVGGFCGKVNTGYIYEDTGNFWDAQTSETTISAMAVGLTTGDMKMSATFTSVGWDFVNVWWMPPDDYPHFLSDDRDGDGLLDSWEVNGIDADGDGLIDLDLPGLGADPEHKDLFVEVDAMIGRAPLQSTLDRVVVSFANVPHSLVNNPDGQNGIALHIQLDEKDIPLASWPNGFGNFDAIKTERFGTYSQHIHTNWANIKTAKKLAYRYCVFADTHSNSTSSGLAECPGNDFMVTLGGWSVPGGTPDQQAGTFMHEFGHNLGLRHGGGDDILFKPNYHSVMDYVWQVPHPLYLNSWVLDYSREIFPDLNEANLSEPNGIGGHVGHMLLVGPPPAKLVDESGPVDWNRDGDKNDTGVSADTNRRLMSQSASQNEILHSHNDWIDLVYGFSGHPNFADGVHSETTLDTEMTFEIFQELTETECMQADVDCDGHVTFQDFTLLGSQWRDVPSIPSADMAPAGGDNIVDIRDLAFLAEHWLNRQ